MEKTEEFYLLLASGVVAGLFTPDKDGFNQIQDENDRTYLDPLELSAHLERTAAQLWPVELRKAAGLIRYYGPQIQEDAQGFNPIDEAAAGLQIVCKYYAPEMLGEVAQLTTWQQTETPAAATLRPSAAGDTRASASTDPAGTDKSNLPKLLKSDDARALFEALVTAGYLGHDWKPTASTNGAAKAYIARTIAADLLGVYNWAKIFEAFWNCKNLPQAFNQIKSAAAYKGINTALAAAVKNSGTLKQTARGKELVKQYGQQN